MRKIFLMITFLMTLLTATAFAEDNIGYDYTSLTYGFKIKCPAKPIVIVNPFEDPKQQGELLVIANDGKNVTFGYQILLDAFDTKAVPNFNKAKQKEIDAYLDKKRAENIYEYVNLETISPNNKGVVVVTAKEIEIENEKGEVVDVITANQKTAFSFFRTSSGRCISIQLITTDFSEDNFNDYRKSVSTFRDAKDKPDKKSK